MNRAAILLLAAGTLWVRILPAQAPAAEPCGRACLEGYIHQYFDALAAHNPFGLPLARKVKFSENDVLLDLGDGAWNTITGEGTYKLILSDPESSQVAVLATMRENSAPITLAARIKIENRKITELETVINRTALAAQALEAGKAAAFPALPPAQRISRDVLLAAGDRYFDAIEKGSADPTAFDKDCVRVENGISLTNNPAQPAPAGLKWNPWALGCAEQINTRIFSSTQRIYPRRFAVIDQERQLVFGFFTYQQPGDLLSIESPGHGVYKFPSSATQPAFTEAAMFFRFTGKKIGRIESITVAVPYGMPDPFFDGDWRKP